jgi:glycosyltransferase involved in cell wall biosynthesis
MSIPLNKKPKIAIVHDFLTYFGGAERVLMTLHKMYFEAPIYTLLYDEKKMKRYFPNAKIRPSFLNKLPKFLRKRKKYLLSLMPTAVETFDLRDFDIVISNSSSFVKGIITKPKTIHICYCHAPTRFLWDWHYNYLAENKITGIKKVFLLPFLHYLRIWDKSASERVDKFIANSKNTAQKIKKFYGRDSVVIYPPVEKLKVCKVHKVESQRDKLRIPNNYFLIVSRLSPYKKIDIAIEAFNKLGFPLIIIGDGEDRKRLQKMAEKNIIFLGFQPEEKIAEYYQNCHAFIFPGEDDFGITIIEAMSFGKPVLAFRKGGALEIMSEGITGEFFDDLIPEILADGVRRLKNNYNNYNPEEIIKLNEKFSKKRFEESVKNIIRESKTG